VLASRLGIGTVDQQQPPEFAQRKPINRNSKMLQFRNDSGFLPTRVGKPGVFTLYMDNKAPKASMY
jgi:hypothetical protein